MVATYTKRKLSGSTSGRQIKVTTTTSPGDLLHTAISGAVDFDEVYLYAVNSTVNTVKVTVLWGGTTDPDDQVEVNIPSESGYYLIIPGLILQGGLEIRVFAAVASGVLINGFCNRIVS